MDDSKRSAAYSAKRLQAISNCESHVASILWAAAKKIVSGASKYRVGRSLRNETAFLRYAMSITEQAEEGITKYISAYSLSSCKVLGIDSENIESFLVSDVYGKSCAKRTAAYLKNFAEDIFRMTKAGILLGYSDQQLISSIRTGYRNPYVTSVITKARRYDINIATPSYGKGTFHAAYHNLVRNARGMVALAWGRAELEYGEDSGAIAFLVFRGSSYPCSTCDYETSYVHKLTDPFPPFHVNCCCFVKFIFSKDELQEISTI